MLDRPYDAVIVGGGFYGVTLALSLVPHLERILLLERAPALLTRASFANQARVHNGYHYPRSFLTALRSRVNYRRFLADQPQCVDDGFEKYYAIARDTSKVTASQFLQFCARVGAPATPAPKAVQALFDHKLIEAVYSVTECAFDAARLSEALRGRIDSSGVEYLLGADVHRVDETSDTDLRVTFHDAGGARQVRARRVFNCTYSGLNRLLLASGRQAVPLKHELTEIALVEMPASLRSIGITVMDGPFFSAMPFPPRGLHSLTHVRYTPHFSWSDAPGEPWLDPDEVLRRCDRRTSVAHMLRDAARYLPAIAGARYVDSLWEVKTVLPRSEVDDSRPILLKRSEGVARLYSVLGAKIDGAYDVQDGVRALLDTDMYAA